MKEERDQKIFVKNQICESSTPAFKITNENVMPERSQEIGPDIKWTILLSIKDLKIMSMNHIIIISEGLYNQDETCEEATTGGKVDCGEFKTEVGKNYNSSMEVKSMTNTYGVDWKKVAITMRLVEKSG